MSFGQRSVISVHSFGFTLIPMAGIVQAFRACSVSFPEWELDLFSQPELMVVLFLNSHSKVFLI